MAVTLSPLDLMLDAENPRFVVLAKREQADIRKYLVTYEDVCQLAKGINDYGGMLPGERIVVLRENNKYVVIEGNRRACSVQMLLSRDLIPDGFKHKIPVVTDETKQACNVIEVDVLPNRNAALELMSKRHIEGVKDWKPIAKKQFFAANFQAGQTIQNLSKITGIKEGDIKRDIREYKFFFAAYNKYHKNHPAFEHEIIRLKIDPFLRVFKTKFEYPAGNKVRPVDVLKIDYDKEHNTVSQLDVDLFNKIVQLVFREAIVTQRIDTRNCMTDVAGIMPLLEQAFKTQQVGVGQEQVQGVALLSDSLDTKRCQSVCDYAGVNEKKEPSNNKEKPDKDHKNTISNSVNDKSGGPLPGGPSPKAFFQTISWHGKLNPSEPSHLGLISALDELHRLSRVNCGKQKAYQVFPIATGMVLRTVYEQALKLRLRQVNLWGTYCQTLPQPTFPALSSMERFIGLGANKTAVLPSRDMVDAFDRVITASHRNFLNANIHNPDIIRMHADSLEGIACGGLFYLIQSIINLLP